MKYRCPAALAPHQSLWDLARAFDEINPQTFPDLPTRVALKESLIQQMADMIVGRGIPLTVIFSVEDPGLKAGFVRIIGETADAIHFLVALEWVSAATGPNDWNLKWQVVRAYRQFNLRFPNDPTIPASATTSLEFLTVHADAALLEGIAAMKTELGITA
jgi:hypothetical protein